MESTGTVFPVSGPGFVNLSRSEYKVLKQLIGSDGDVGAAHDTLRRDPPLDLVYTGPADALNDHPGPDPIALITPTGGPFGHELSAGDKLQELTKATELELAEALCKAAGSRALLDDGSPAPDCWWLVTRDGSYGRVQTDPTAKN